MANWEELANRTASAVINALGGEVEYQHVAQDVRYTIEKAAFSEPGILVSAGGHVDIRSTNPTLAVKNCDFKFPPKQGDLVVRKGKTYEVVDIDPDGEAAVVLILQDFR